VLSLPRAATIEDPREAAFHPFGAQPERPSRDAGLQACPIVVDRTPCGIIAAPGQNPFYPPLRDARLLWPSARCFSAAACGGWRRGRENIHKRYLIHVAGYNPGLIMCLLTGARPQRELHARAFATCSVLSRRMRRFSPPFHSPTSARWSPVIAIGAVPLD
jgi:hypothetical protein